MLMQSRLMRLLAVMLASVASFGLFSGAEAQTAVNLSIGTAAGVKGEVVDVPVTLSSSSMASTVVFGISFDAQSLQVVSVGEGSALAPDQLIIAPPSSAGTVAIAAYGMGNAIRNGELCVVSFRVLSDDSGVVDLAGLDTASAASLTGVSLPVTIMSGEVFINCEGHGPDAPSGVTASQGDSSEVTVSWNAVGGASSYRVYRAKSTDPENVEAVSEWLAGVTWVDTSAAGPGNSVAVGCQGGGNLPVHYYYWVRARGEGGCPSELSEAAEGWVVDKVAVQAAGLAGAGPGEVLVFSAMVAGLWAGAIIKNRRRRC